VSDEVEVCIEALRPPVLAPLSSTSDLRIRVTVSQIPDFMPDDYVSRIEYAIAVTAPRSDSPVWRLAGLVPGLGSVTTSRRIPGETIWVHARGEAPGFQPSAWTVPVSFAVDAAIPQFTSLVLSPTYELQWAGNAALGGVRIRWGISTVEIIPSYGSPVDRDAADTTFQVPDVPPAGSTLTVQAEAWTEFSMGSVGGAQGMIATVSRFRESEGGTLPILDPDGDDVSIDLSSSAGWQVPVYTADGLQSFISLTIDGDAPAFEADGDAAHIQIAG
jgi:hypothetical protein